MRKILVFVLSAIFLVFPFFVSAQGLNNALDNLESSIQGTGLEQKDSLEQNIADIITAGLSILGTVFFVLTIYAGYLWMTARGEEAKVEESERILTAAVIGLAIVLSAYAITTFVTSRLVGQ